MIHREPSHPPRRSLAPEEIQTFADEGVVCLRGIIPLPLIDRLRDGIDQAFAEFAGSFGDFDIQSALNEAKAAGAKLRESGRALLRTDEGRHNELIRDFAWDSPLAEIAAGLMKSRRIRFFQDQIFLKEPGASARMGFHQDLSYFPIARHAVLCLLGAGRSRDPGQRSDGIRARLQHLGEDLRRQYAHFP